jgi:hypothetical protein
VLLPEHKGMGNKVNENYSIWGNSKLSHSFLMFSSLGEFWTHTRSMFGEAGIQLELKQAGISYIGCPVLLSPLPGPTYLCYLL